MIYDFAAHTPTGDIIWSIIFWGMFVIFICMVLVAAWGVANGEKDAASFLLTGLCVAMVWPLVLGMAILYGLWLGLVALFKIPVKRKKRKPADPMAEVRRNLRARLREIGDDPNVHVDCATSVPHDPQTCYAAEATNLRMALDNLDSVK